MSDVTIQLEEFLDALSGITYPLLFGLIGSELLILWLRKKWIAKKESWVTVASFGLGTLPYEVFFAVLQFQGMMWLYENARIFTLGNEWYVWVLAFFAFELAWWLVHFAAHKIRFLWCIHGVHHTPTEMNICVAIRGSIFDFVQYVHLVLWLPILGFHPFMVFAVDTMSRLYGLLTHVHRDFLPRMRIVDRFFVTPELHSVHHASNSVYLDTNYGNFLSLWDWLFRTHRREMKGIEPVFGVTDDSVNASSILSSQFGLWKSLIVDIRSTPKWSDKIKYCFMPPDWRPRS